MDMQQIKNFLKLSDELHFWRTANTMNITQSALSRQIKALEDELGFALFDRNKRNVKLTPQGAFLKEKWTVLLKDLDYIHSFARKINEGEVGKIRIVHPDSISYSLLPDILVRINKSYPKLSIELVQLLYESTQKSLLEYKIDIAFTRQINKSTGIFSTKIKSEPLAVFVPVNHLFVQFTDLTKENLERQHFILPVAKSNSSFHFIVQEIFDSFGISPRSIYNSDFGSSILGLVSKGLGIAILPISFAKNNLLNIRAIEMPYFTELFINWRADESSPAIKNVLQTITSFFDIENL